MRCTFATIVLLLAFAPSPASAHGENDARAIAKGLAVGPYEISVWQVIGDHDSAMSSHVVVDFGATVRSIRGAACCRSGVGQPGLARGLAGESNGRHVADGRRGRLRRCHSDSHI